MSITVFGHKNPDTDSIASAIVAAWYFTEKGQPAVAARLGAVQNEPAFVLERFGVAAPELLEEVSDGQKVVLVDTNNPGELPDTIGKAELVAIIDHHKLAGLTYADPILVAIEPVACTATVLYRLMQHDGLLERLPKEMAGLMLAAIVSDTLNFTSPTTTDVDKEVAAKLALLAALNTDELAKGMFDAKSDLSGFSAADLLQLDSKVFEIAGKTVRVATLETTNPQIALGMLPEIQEAMAVEKAGGKDAVFMFVVDILKSDSTLIVNGELEKEIAEKAFSASLHEDGTMHLPGVVSRKKQMIPPIERAMSA